MVKRTTWAALTLAFLLLTAVIASRTMHLRRQDALSPEIQVDWMHWTAAVVLVYVGLGLIGWWAAARDRAVSTLAAR